MKCFLTIGTQAPFDRLIKLVDDWLLLNDNIECYGQIGKSIYKPQNMKYSENLDEETFNRTFLEADIILSHAGMGTIITACKLSKPILVLPRLKKFNEHRNNHQVDTIKSMSKAGYVYPVFTDNEFIKRLDNISNLKSLKRIDENPTSQLIDFIEDVL